MGRRQEILRHIAADAYGIEIAPWFNPIIPPNGSRRVVVLDVLDRPALMARAENDPLIDAAMMKQIGDVELVGSACEIAELTAARFGAEERFDFVVSSHNLEHLPDPVRFFRGCESLLKTGGVLAMAVPDKRACFDFFRPHSETAELLQAFHEHRERPTFAQTFSQGAYSAVLREPGGDAGAFTIDNDPAQIDAVGDLALAHKVWLDRLNGGDTEYHDTHCWTFTPSSLELILTELTMLGLMNFDIVSVTETSGCEFFVHMRKRPQDAPAQTDLAGRRQVMLRQIIDEIAYNSRYAWGLRGGTSTRRGKNWRDTRLGLFARRVRRRLLRKFAP